jgi:hypothetical protein
LIIRDGHGVSLTKAGRALVGLGWADRLADSLAVAGAVGADQGAPSPTRWKWRGLSGLTIAWLASSSAEGRPARWNCAAAGTAPTARTGWIRSVRFYDFNSVYLHPEPGGSKRC